MREHARRGYDVHPAAAAALRADGLDCPALLSSGHWLEELTGRMSADTGFLKKPYRPAEWLSAVLSARGV